MKWVVEAKLFPGVLCVNRAFVGVGSVSVLHQKCRDVRVRSPFCRIWGFRRRVRRGGFSIRCFPSVFQKKAGGVFTVVSGAHVTHIHAVRLQVLSRMICGHFARRARHF